MFKKILPNVHEISDFFDKSDAEHILKAFQDSKKWDHVVQKKSEHYSHVFKNDSVSMPDVSETYLSSFWKNLELSSDPFIKESTIKAIKKFFFIHYDIQELEIDIRCHKFEKNDFFRVHMDGYAGGYALTISFNKNWKWDWGGILNIVHGNEDSQLLGLLPKWNSANILNNYLNPSPHFVTPVQQFALETRYTITCFVKKLNKI
jgi:Rps23 Pro-64 3,4-dihydroxylase Tpa1-like proline 4-hydroxylase